MSNGNLSKADASAEAEKHTKLVKYKKDAGGMLHESIKKILQSDEMEMLYANVAYDAFQK